MSKQESCIYCGCRLGTTRDHTPPRCFFGGTLPNNALLVPCCEVCRKIGEKNETTVRNLLVSFDCTEIHPLAQTTLIGKRNRSFQNDIKEVNKLMSMMKDVQVLSPGGIYLGTAKAFNLKHPLMDSFVARMSRALLYVEHGQLHFPGTFDWRLNPPVTQDIIVWMSNNWPSKHLSNVFSYSVSNPHLGRPFWINMVFYQRVLIMARVDLEQYRIIEQV
jgi:hypothetical protein